jgi:integrase
MLAKIQPRDFLPWIAERQRPRTRTAEKQVIGKDGKARTERTKKTTPGASGATLNRDLALASAVFSWAIRAGYVEENPVRKVERFNERGRERETYLTADEARALVGACSPVLRPVVMAALHTGMRRGELLALRWRAVDLDRRELLVEAATEKAGRGRVVPLTDALCSTLAALKADRKRPALDGSDAVFTDHAEAPLTRSAVQYIFPRTVSACEALPLAKRGKVTFHALRHTAASLMVAAGVPLFDVAKILGHSTLAMTMRYAHFAPEAGRAAVEALGKALTSAGAERRGSSL